MDDLILQRGNAHGPLSPVAFGDPNSTGWLSPISSAVNTIVEVPNVLLQVSLVTLPSHTIHSTSCVSLELVKALDEQLLIDVMHQGGETERAVLLGSLAHAAQA